MPTHRVDISMKGMAHYVDGQFVDASGFPFWDDQLPQGLHMESRVGSPAKSGLKFVRKPGFGKSIEWTSNREARGAQEARGPLRPPPGWQQGPQAGPEAGSQRGDRRGPPRGYQGGERRGPQRGQEPEEPDEEPGQEERRGPGLFDVAGGDSEDGDDGDGAHSMAYSRRDDAEDRQGLLRIGHRREQARAYGPKGNRDNAHLGSFNGGGGGSHSRI